MGRIAELVPGGAGGQRFQDRRRRSQRYSLHEELEVRDSAVLRGMTLDLSAGGLRAALEGIVMIGEKCSLAVSTGGAHTYTQDATVVWIRPAAERFVVGFAFD